MELLVEIEAKNKEEEVYFIDAYLEDLMIEQGSTIAAVLTNAKTFDAVVVYLSQGEELLNIWELGVTPETCGQTLLETFKDINNYVKRSKNENQRTHARRGNTDSPVRQFTA